MTPSPSPPAAAKACAGSQIETAAAVMLNMVREANSPSRELNRSEAARASTAATRAAQAGPNSSTDGTGVSDGSAIRDNQIVNTGGRFTTAIGIHTWGTVDIVGNTVSNVTAIAGTSGTPEATGIDINDNPGTLVERNIVRGLVSSGGYSYGIHLSSDSGRVYFKDNDVLGRSSEANGYGIRCDGGESPALLHGNALLTLAHPWTGCTDGGNNSEVLP